MGNDVGRLKIQLPALLDRLLQLYVYFLRKTLLHHSIVENIFTENFRYINLFCAHIDPFLLRHIDDHSGEQTDHALLRPSHPRGCSGSRLSAAARYGSYIKRALQVALERPCSCLRVTV